MNDGDLRKEHLEKVAAGVRAPLNGLIDYTYNGDREDEDYERFGLANIGDSIQSLAARQYFATIDRLVDREQLGDYDGAPVNMIMNAWYKIWRRNMVFSPAINPLLVSIYLRNPEVLTAESLAYFKRNEPVGCRDVSTAEFFLAHGIKAYFTGCLTLTLGRTYRLPEQEKREGVYFVDYLFGYDEAIDVELRKLLNGFTRKRACYVRSHFYPTGIDSTVRLQEAESLIREYARAELVVTRNIHCALPCLALGTPVIFLTPKYDARRFSGLIGFFNRIGYDEKHRFVCEVLRNADGKIVNPDRHLEYAAHLEKIAELFGGGGFSGLEPHSGPLVPRRRYGQAERETGFWRKLWQLRKLGEARQLVLFGRPYWTFSRQQEARCPN